MPVAILKPVLYFHRRCKPGEHRPQQHPMRNSADKIQPLAFENRSTGRNGISRFCLDAVAERALHPHGSRCDPVLPRPLAHPANQGNQGIQGSVKCLKPQGSNFIGCWEFDVGRWMFPIPGNQGIQGSSNGAQSIALQVSAPVSGLADPVRSSGFRRFPLPQLKTKNSALKTE